jgi:hypothetical protein
LSVYLFACLIFLFLTLIHQLTGFFNVAHHPRRVNTFSAMSADYPLQLQH